MKCVLVGYRDVDFVGTDGNQVKGKTIYIEREDQYVTGTMCENFFVSSRLLSNLDLDLGSEYEIFFNRRGKIDTINLTV